ncbi:FadR/GntR family transcriptional regulator [Marinobacterium aestuariivivens]|uniref:FadR/GntR family transcriptional regulator n=1 Tax=Marinobacterium aestuariivivens TaxID=1698799 RepID=A0ABW2A2T9_9GAMM
MKAAEKSSQLTARLADEILDGTLLPGTLLPSERRLAEDHGLSRATVREAIRTLELRGLVETRQGDGSRCRNLLEPHFRMPPGGADSLALQLQVQEMRAALEGRPPGTAHNGPAMPSLAASTRSTSAWPGAAKAKRP